MTTDARNSTLDANQPVAQEGGVLAALVLGNLRAAEAFGFDGKLLREQAGLSDALFADPDGRVPFEHHVLLWESIERDPRAVDLGIWLGSSIGADALGVVGYVMQHAPDVRTALHCLERFNRLLGDGIGPSLTERAEQVVLHRVEPPRLACLQAMSIAAPLGMVTLLRQLAGLTAHETIALEATFQHPPLAPEAGAQLSQLLGCPLVFNAPETRLVLPRALLDRALVAPHVGLLSYLERHAETLQAKLRDSASLSARIREIITAHLREGEPTQRAVAKLCAMSERTLQRRLQEEGTTFVELLEEVRFGLSRLYLDDPQLAVFEVAFLLGYSEPSAFNRAFRRWTGGSPSEFRRGGAT